MGIFMTVRSLILAAAAVAVASLAAAPVLAAPTRPQTTPLAEPNLFISPSGQPFRSKAGEPYPVVAWFNKTDTNHDGKIDREEFRAEATAFFNMLNVRKNGVIDDEIIDLYEKRIVPEIINANIQAAGAPTTSDSPAYSSPSDYKTKRQGAAQYGLLNNAEPLRSADRSFRGLIQLKDMLAQADQNFDELDYDHKGYLTLEDLPRPPAEETAEPMKASKKK
jgi:hypothetical protein